MHRVICLSMSQWELDQVATHLNLTVKSWKFYMVDDGVFFLISHT